MKERKIDIPHVVWVDLTEMGSDLVSAFNAQTYHIHRIQSVAQIDDLLDEIQPIAMCFEYDYPESSDLLAFSESKTKHPSIPVVMITNSNSAMLAVWALRARVWDYVVKPCSVEDLQLRFGSLVRSGLPANDISFLLETSRNSKVVLKSRRYVESNLDQKIRVSDVASFCGMSRSHFSRKFRQECGKSFSEFVSQVRIGRAMDLLSDTSATIKAVSFEVGYQDPSYFGRMFRRYTGMCPSEYQKIQSKRLRAVA